MIPAILAGAATLIFVLIFFSLQEYREYELRRRINRMLIRQRSRQYSVFSFMGTLKKRIDEVVNELFPGLDPDMFIIYTLYGLCAILAISGIMGNIGLGIAIDIVAVVCVFIYLDTRRSNLYFKLEQQFGTFTRDVATYLRANPNLINAIEAVTGHTAPPLRPYLETLVMKVEAGESIDKALREFADEIKVESAVSWVTSIIFARMAKSNLTDVCEHTAERINRKLIRSMNIRATLSKTKGMIMAILGIVALMIINSIAGMPDTRELFLNTGSGQFVLMYVIVSLFATTYMLLRKINGIAKK